MSFDIVASVGRSYSGLRRTKSAKTANDEFIMHYVYILKCKNGDLYVGCTADIKDRVERHKRGHVPATVSNLPVRLINVFIFSNKYKAFKFERYLKSGSGRAFINKHLE